MCCRCGGANIFIDLQINDSNAREWMIFLVAHGQMRTSLSVLLLLLSESVMDRETQKTDTGQKKSLCLASLWFRRSC